MLRRALLCEYLILLPGLVTRDLEPEMLDHSRFEVPVYPSQAIRHVALPVPHHDMIEPEPYPHPAPGAASLRASYVSG